jgi:hypothetical protein
MYTNSTSILFYISLIIEPNTFPTKQLSILFPRTNNLCVKFLVLMVEPHRPNFLEQTIFAACLHLITDSILDNRIKKGPN